MMTSRGGVGPSMRPALFDAFAGGAADEESVAPHAAPDAIVASVETAINRASARRSAVVL